MEYSQISKVNSEISMIDLKGKNYAMVPERINAFRKIFPDGFINTEIISHDGTTVLMKAQAGYYNVEGNPIVLGTGYAQEIRGKGLVNGTSYIENCETSAVGRALGMIGLGINGGGICSAEELVNAITAQRQMEEEKLPKGKKQPASAQVTTGNTIPNVIPISEEKDRPISGEQRFILCCIGQMKKDIEKFDFVKMRKILIDEGLISDKKSDEMSMDEAVAMVSQFYITFGKMSIDDSIAKANGMLLQYKQETAK